MPDFLTLIAAAERWERAEVIQAWHDARTPLCRNEIEAKEKQLAELMALPEPAGLPCPYYADPFRRIDAVKEWFESPERTIKENERNMIIGARKSQIQSLVFEIKETQNRSFGPA